MGRWLVLLLLLSSLLGCGFQLRGSYTLPFNTMYINLPLGNTLRAALARTISAGTGVRLVEQAKDAQATLLVTADSSTKNILALNAAGRTREFRLQRTLGFRVVNPAGLNWLPEEDQIVVYRDMTYSDDQVLAKGFEETLLWHDMENDLAQQILRRLALAKTPVAVKAD